MKELLNEWRKFLLTEVQTLRLIDLTTSAKENGYSQNDIQFLTQFWNNNSKIRSKYSKVIEKEISDPNKNEPIEHILSAVINHYENVYDKLSSDEKMKLANANGFNIGSLRVNADVYKQEAEANVNPMNFRSSGIRKQCKYKNGRPVVGKYKDFDVVYSSNDWIVIEPKTVKGSIAWSHGKPDGSEESDSKYRVTWCTGTKSDNYFLEYAVNYHMFYCIKTDYDKVKESSLCRLCLAFISYNGEVFLANDKKNIPNEISSLYSEDVVVDDSNDNINKNEILSVLNTKIYNSLEKLCAGRKETHVELKIKGLKYDEIVNLIEKSYNGFYNDLNDNNTSIYVTHCNPLFIEDLYWLKGFKDKKNLAYQIIEYWIAQREDLLEADPSGFIISMLIANPPIRYYRDIVEEIVSKKYFIKLDNVKSLLIRFLKIKNNHDIKMAIAQREDLLEIDPSGFIIETLYDDESEVIQDIVYNNYEDYIRRFDKYDLEESLLKNKISSFLF